jgi:uncharacterized protein (DUF2336 family)
MTERSLIAEIENIFASGSSQKQAEILRRVTDLFLADVNNYSELQVDLFDGVISRLADKIETRARAELANRLASVENAPPVTIRNLAYDEEAEVAIPVLTHSPRLSDEDLITIAKRNHQPRMLAISKRATVSESISDVLVSRGNREVVLSVTQNEGARFSDTSYGTLVRKSLDDDVLAICVGMRKDIPRQHFQTLISKASQVVFEKLASSNPTAVAEVQKILAGITGQNLPAGDKPSEALAGKRPQSADLAVFQLALGGKVAETVAALSTLCQTSSELVGNVLNDRRASNDFTLLLAKAAGLSWPTAKQLCIMRRGEAGLSVAALDAAEKHFERLQLETARRVVSFYNERRTAIASFQQLEDQMREESGTTRPARFTGATAVAVAR